MRPVLLPIPAKPLFVLALCLAAVALARDLIRRRRDPSVPWSSTALYLIIGAEVLLYFKADTFWPGPGAFAHPWTPVPIYAYGVMLGTSLVVGWFIAMRLAGKDGIDQQEAGTIYMWTAVWSIVGSRVLWYFTDNTNPNRSIVEILMINQGGLVAYGGMIGGFLASVYCCRKRGIPLLQWADVAAPSVVLGTAITRIGCFLFGCDYGARSNLPWAVQFPGPNTHKWLGIITGAPTGSPAWQHHYGQSFLEACKQSASCWSDKVHPTQIYESLVGLALFGLLMLIRKYRKFSGQVFLGWVMGYGLLRPLIEQVRDDDDRGVRNLSGFQLSTSTVIGLVSVVLGVALLIALIRKYRRDPDGSKLWLHPVAVVPAAVQAKGEQGGGGKRRKRR